MTYLKDTLTNLVAQLNTGRDKQAHTSFVERRLERSELDSMYFSNWLAGKIVDIVANDMTRKWREVNSSEVDNDKLDTFRRAEKALGVKAAFNKAEKYARLYGGAGILIGIKDEDPETPLDVDTIRPDSLQYLYVAHKHELTSNGTVGTDPAEPDFCKPTFYQFSGSSNGLQLRIHHTRVLRFDGIPLPDDIASTNGYWGLPILQRVYDAVKDAETATTTTGSMMHEAVVDVLSVKGLAGHLASPSGAEGIISRFRIGRFLKSMNNMLLIDKDTEEYHKEAQQFTALPDLITRYHHVAASAADVPATRLLGESAPGLNATGEQETRNYEERINADQESKLSPNLEILDRILLKSSLALDVPDDWESTWVELGSLTELERADKELKDAQKDAVYLQNEVVTRSIVAKNLQTEGVYDSLDNDYIEVLEEIEGEEDEEPEVVMVPQPPQMAPADPTQQIEPNGDTDEDPQSGA